MVRCQEERSSDASPEDSGAHVPLAGREQSKGACLDIRIALVVAGTRHFPHGEPAQWIGVVNSDTPCRLNLGGEGNPRRVRRARCAVGPEYGSQHDDQGTLGL